jgi:hypothetical protein
MDEIAQEPLIQPEQVSQKTVDQYKKEKQNRNNISRPASTVHINYGYSVNTLRQLQQINAMVQQMTAQHIAIRNSRDKHYRIIVICIMIVYLVIMAIILLHAIGLWK